MSKTLELEKAHDPVSSSPEAKPQLTTQVEANTKKVSFFCHVQICLQLGQILDAPWCNLQHS